MSGVESVGPSCCSWLPCVSASATQGGLKNRVCMNWRMIPGILALVACVAAVACALIWNSPYLCIAFAPGLIASVYLIYLGWEYQTLTSFTENNHDLKASIHTLEKKNEEMLNKLQVFEEENKKLQEASTHLSELVGKLTSENSNLSRTNKDLEKNNRDLEKNNRDLEKTTQGLKEDIKDLNANIGKLEELRITLEEKAGRHVEQLSILEKSLSGIEASAKGNHATFAVNLQTFIQEVQSLEITRKNFENTGSVIEEKMKEQVQVLITAAKMLEAIFLKINDWKDEDYVVKRLEEQKLIDESISKLNDNYLNTAKNLAKMEGQMEEQKKQIQELAQLKEGFSMALLDLLNQIAHLKEVKGDLALEVKKVSEAAQIFLTYDFRRSHPN